MLKVKTPCLITALSELNEARYMSVGGIVDAYNKSVTVWGFDDLKDDLNPEFIGLKGSPTNVFQSFGKQLRAAPASCSITCLPTKPLTRSCRS